VIPYYIKTDFPVSLKASESMKYASVFSAFSNDEPSRNPTFDSVPKRLRPKSFLFQQPN
jgi:hypothetical protein